MHAQIRSIVSLSSIYPTVWTMDFFPFITIPSLNYIAFVVEDNLAASERQELPHINHVEIGRIWDVIIFTKGLNEL